MTKMLTTLWPRATAQAGEIFCHPNPSTSELLPIPGLHMPAHDSCRQYWSRGRVRGVETISRPSIVRFRIRDRDLIFIISFPVGA